MHVPIGPITRARARQIQEAMAMLIQEYIADKEGKQASSEHMGLKDAERPAVNLIRASENIN